MHFGIKKSNTLRPRPLILHLDDFSYKLMSLGNFKEFFPTCKKGAEEQASKSSADQNL